MQKLGKLICVYLYIYLTQLYIKLEIKKMYSFYQINSK